MGGLNAYLYANASPTIFNDPYGLWAGVDDAAAIIGGALVGLAVQGAVDLVTGHFSGWEQYAGAAVSGAVMGEVLLYTGNPWLAGAAGGLAGNLTSQGLRNLTGKQDGFDVCSMMLDTVLGGVGGKAGELLGRGAAALGKRLAGRAGAAAAGAEDDVARQVANGVDDAAKKPGIAENGARGRASEKRVLEDMGLSKNTRKVTTDEGSSIPDALTDKISLEVKDTIRVDLTKQLRIQTDAARASGRQSILVTGLETKVSPQAESAFDRIIRRPDLGPPPVGK